MRRCFFFLPLVLLFTPGCAFAPRTGTDAPVQLTPTLANSAEINAWTLDGSGAWKIVDNKLVLWTAGVPSGPIRRPAALAILRSEEFRRASVSVELRSTASPEVRQRDLQLIAAYQSPTRFYYVHLAGITDLVHNGVFLVAGADRRRIDSGTAPPQLPDQSWHRVRLDWDGALGTISVYVDDSHDPVLHARDSTLLRGRIGFGSFDDTGEFRNIRVTGWK